MFKRKKKKQERSVYDDAEALEFIYKETGYPRKFIRNVMNADLRYQKSVGIIDWPDLDDFIAYWTDLLDKRED